VNGTVQVETFKGRGRLLNLDGQELAPVDYEYQIDRTHRVWKGIARRSDLPDERMEVRAGPALLEVSSGERGPVHFYHHNGEKGIEIVFTGRGAPPGE
jgi:hypothetical protein